MGKHSTGKTPFGRRHPAVSRKPNEISHLEPASTSSETASDARRRQRDALRPVVDTGARKRFWKRIAGALGISFALLGVVAAAAAYLWVEKLDRQINSGQNISKDQQAAIDEVLDPEPNKPEAPFYMLLIGADTRPGDTQSRSDTLILARIDPGAKRVSLMSIPRDTRVKVPGHGKQKINAAYALGGPLLAIKTVKELTGVPISHYTIVNFYGFKQIVDAMGGVWIDVPMRIKDDRAANHSDEYAKLKPGYQKLNGGQALTFVRSRKFPDGDLQRIKNQQAFLKALMKQALQVENVWKAPQIANAVAGHITSDMTVGQMIGIANDLRGMSPDDLYTASMPGAPKYINGASYVLADEDELKAMLDRMRRGMPLKSEDASGTPGTPDPLSPEQVSVTVRNGAGIGGVASEASQRLDGGGYDVQSTGNMNQFVYDRTLIVFKDDDQRASLVREFLGFGDVVRSNGMYSFETDILVVVGKDWRELAPGQASLPLDDRTR